MNQAVVVDASVAIKRVLAEEFTEQSRALFSSSLKERRPVLAPPHLRSEVTNAFYQRWRTTVAARRITEAEAERALAAFLRLPITLLAPEDLYTSAFAFAKTHRLPSIYDSLYVVLAQLTNTKLWTADRRLYNAVSAMAPWVAWIGDYPLGA
jgi:predicted nucleic acid-binding protein